MPLFTVTVHPLPGSSSLIAYERITKTATTPSRNALIYIGGLTTGPHTTDIPFLVDMLSDNPDLSYTVFELRMRSSFSGWGYSSLKNDVEDLGELVRYLRQDLGKEKVVMLGASTGLSHFFFKKKIL